MIRSSGPASSITQTVALPSYIRTWPDNLCISSEKTSSLACFGNEQSTTSINSLIQPLITQPVKNILFSICLVLTSSHWLLYLSPLRERELRDVGIPSMGKYVCWFLSLHSKQLIQLQFSYGRKKKKKRGKQKCSLTIYCHRIYTGGRQLGRYQSTRCTWSWGSFRSL